MEERKLKILKVKQFSHTLFLSGTYLRFVLISLGTTGYLALGHKTCPWFLYSLSSSVVHMTVLSPSEVLPKEHVCCLHFRQPTREWVSSAGKTALPTNSLACVASLEEAGSGRREISVLPEGSQKILSFAIIGAVIMVLDPGTPITGLGSEKQVKIRIETQIGKITFCICF